MTEGTPASWRAAASAILAGGLAVGYASTRNRLAGNAVRLAAVITGAWVVPLARASRRPPIDPGRQPSADAPPLAAPPTFTVIVAARDEAGVLPNIVRDVAAQDHRDLDGQPLFDLLVVDDRSVDGTGDAVRAAAVAAGIGDRTMVVRRDGAGLSDGKGAALTAAQPDACAGDWVVVLDADARIRPDFLSRLARYAAAGAVAVTARRRILDADRSWLGGAQADEQTLDGEIQRGRWSLGGCSEFRGNGIVVRRDLLQRVGGWRAGILNEDLDLSSRLAAQAGATVAWALDAEVWEEPVETWHGLVAQRDRWAEGALRRTFEHLPAVVRSRALPPAARIDFVVYAFQLAIPPAVLGALLGSVGRRRGGGASVLLLPGAYLAVAAALAWDALRWESAGPGDSGGQPMPPAERATRATRAALFSAIWLLCVPRALWRLATASGGVRYVKMDHRGGGPEAWKQ